ncbi:NADH ubiquinone oxidoreductase [Rhodosalinus halophilus]|uniref:NADH ubiquinone oxidoreductase n=1 Tax=Rhodosalinus halophilus TaxID=2259333 RepID=A0A365UD29_9RHOB|nr:CIA30 family protein [Rhodosalinus halophilus]RBI86615.1 NADH ubiquinone oxidoreductase [Rhodosalinus halophilus]
MRHVLALCLSLLAAPAMPDTLIEDFAQPSGAEWRFFTDQVMGGVSTGEATIVQDGRPALRLTGQVSTENRGGFIQARKELPEGLPDDAQALRITVRGDGQRYFLHLRTTGTLLPWQYYQAGFEAPQDWTELRVPLSAFAPSGRLLRRELRPEAVRSVALVAYGRDHEARVELARIAAD